MDNNAKMNAGMRIGEQALRDELEQGNRYHLHDGIPWMKAVDIIAKARGVSRQTARWDLQTFTVDLPSASFVCVAPGGTRMVRLKGSR